jgi:cell division protein FtsZ
MCLKQMDTKEVKIIGVGCYSQNILETTANSNFENAEYIFCNIDAASLKKNQSCRILQIGKITTDGSGTGGNMELGKLSAIESREQIAQLFDENSNLAIFIAGFNGGTGVGATPVMVEIAKEKQQFVIAVVHSLYEFVPGDRHIIIDEAIARLRCQADFVLVIDNNKIERNYTNHCYKNEFGTDWYISQFIRMLAFMDSSSNDAGSVKNIVEKIKKGKSVYFGYGEGQGKFRERKAIFGALKNALSDREDIYGVRNAFIYIRCNNTEITLYEIAVIRHAVLQNSVNEIEITFSIEKDFADNDEISIVIIAS